MVLEGPPAEPLGLELEGPPEELLGLEELGCEFEARRTNCSDFGVSAFAVAEMGLSAHSHPK